MHRGRVGTDGVGDHDLGADLVVVHRRRERLLDGLLDLEHQHAVVVLDVGVGGLRRWMAGLLGPSVRLAQRARHGSEIGHGWRTQALVGIGAEEKEQAESDERSDPVAGVERREVVEEDLPRSDHEEPEGTAAQHRSVAAETEDEGADAGHRPQAAQEVLA